MRPESAIVAKVYSAVLSDHTCDRCAALDGMHCPPSYDGLQAPNPDCAHGLDGCECIWVYVMSDEAISLVGPTRHRGWPPGVTPR